MPTGNYTHLIAPTTGFINESASLQGYAVEAIVFLPNKYLILRRKYLLHKNHGKIPNTFPYSSSYEYWL